MATPPPYAEGVRGGAVGDDRLGALPREGREGRLHLGHHAAPDGPVGDERLGPLGGDGVEPRTGRVADAVDVGQQHELARPEPRREPGRRVVGVDVADDALLVPRQRGHDRDLARHHQRVEEVAPDAGHRGHEAHVRQAPADQQAAVDARQADRVAAHVAQRRDELAVDHPAQDRGRHLERGRVRDPQAVLEPGLDPEALEPLGHPLAAPVDEDDRAAARDLGHLDQHLLLLGERRATELDDDDLAHVVYSEFSRT
jgi:hypothetical protein